MKKSILFILLLCIFSLCNLYEEKVYEKVTYSIANLNHYTIGVSTESNEDYIERVVVRVELNYEVSVSDTEEEYSTILAANIEKNRRRVELKEEHKRKNELYFDDLGIDNYDTFYICKYSPHIELEYFKNDFILHKDEILSTLENNELVKSVSVIEYETSYNEYLTYVMNSMNMGSIYTNRTYTGSGVTIGLLEQGMIDVNDQGIAGSNYTIHDQPFVTEEVHQHTTIMAQLMAGNYGVAKNAHLLNSYRVGSMSNEIEWMIDNGVDVINMSFGFGDKGTYNNDSAYVDYIVKNYGVFVCVASGNSDEDNNEYVDNPGMAYNALTIGAADDSDGINGYSCFRVTTGANKPNIVVVGEGVNIPNTTLYTSGTSVACAIMTGTVALLFEKYPGLVGKPLQTMAIINASCMFYPTYTTRLDNGYNQLLGAGEFMFDRACTAYNTIRWVTVGSDESGLYVHSDGVNMSVGQKIKIAIVRLVHATGIASQTTFSDFDMDFYEDGQVVASTYSTVDNVEIIEYTALKSGYHSWKVFKFDSETTSDEVVAIAYYLN